MEPAIAVRYTRGRQWPRVGDAVISVGVPRDGVLIDPTHDLEALETVTSNRPPARVLRALP